MRDKKTTDSIIVSINNMRVGFSYPTDEVVLPLLALSKIGSKEAIDTIYEFYLRKHDDYALAQLAMAAVIDENEYAYDVLLKAQSLIATYEYQSAFLEKKLVNIGNKRAIEFLIESLNHDNPMMF